MTEPGHYSIPKEPGGRGALVLALVVHLALVAFLWIGVSWQSQDHGGVEAEVWDVQYREAAPKQPEPVQEKREISKPEPKQIDKPVEKAQVAKADIALEQEKKRKAEAKKKAEYEKRQKLEDEKRKKADAADKRKQELVDQKNREKLRAEEMRRIAGATGTGGSGTAPRSTGNNRGDPGYGNKVGAKIRSNTAFVVPSDLDGNPAVEYAIELLPDGCLRATPRMRKSSGVPGFDDAVLKAIKKSEPFPQDSTGKVPSSFILIHKPKG
jgi:colicin import membrane protein